MIPSSLFTQSCIFTGLLVTLVQLMFITSLNLSKNSGLMTLSVFFGIITSELISHYRFGEQNNPLCIAGMVLLVYGVAKTTLNKDK
jgi:multidrug transporter EmrE-like cation transporter